MNSAAKTQWTALLMIIIAVIVGFCLYLIIVKMQEHLRIT